MFVPEILTCWYTEVSGVYAPFPEIFPRYSWYPGHRRRELILSPGGLAFPVSLLSGFRVLNLYALSTAERIDYSYSVSYPRRCRLFHCRARVRVRVLLQRRIAVCGTADPCDPSPHGPPQGVRNNRMDFMIIHYLTLNCECANMPRPYVGQVPRRHLNLYNFFDPVAPMASSTLHDGITSRSRDRRSTSSTSFMYILINIFLPLLFLCVKGYAGNMGAGSHFYLRLSEGSA